MTYIENIFICLAAPLIVAMFFSSGKHRKAFLFFLCGMLSCLLSAYISTFMAAALGADQLTAAIEVTPAIEEMMKLFPVLFYLLVFEPSRGNAAGGMLMAALGFATFENVCYLSVNRSAELIHLLIRGFGTGTMHVVCGAIVGLGLLYLWYKPWIRAFGTIGLLCAAITYHAIYNLLVTQDGIPMLAGFLIPILTTVVALIFFQKPIQQMASD